VEICRNTPTTIAKMIESLKTKIESGKYKPRSMPKGVVIEKKAK
tara:strand:+ start:807 stop:938 length:132 start_codon:yes stop_codon:yes gene_type:complete